MLTTDSYFDTIRRAWTDEIVVCSLGTTADSWWNATRSTSSFYVNAAMGFASSVALGIALRLAHARVWALDSDGALAMNLGGILTEAAAAPPNFAHIVLDNSSYGCLHGAPLVNAGRTDYAAIARDAGIAAAVSVESADELSVALARSRTGHAFIVAHVPPPPRGVGLEPPLAIPLDGPELKYAFGRHMESRFGIQVFGPQGY